MLVNFDELPETSKVWIFQASRSLTDQEQEEIKENNRARSAKLRIGIKK